MEEIKEAIEPQQPNESVNITDEEAIKKANEEHEKLTREYAEKVVEAIKAGYEQAKTLAEDIRKKTLSTWFFEKDLARLLRSDLKGTQGLLKQIDSFGFLEVKVTGAAVQFKINRKPEKCLEKIMRDRHQLHERVAQIETLIMIVNEDIQNQGQQDTEKGDTNDIMQSVK